MDLGWHFNYTDDQEHQKQVLVDTGEEGGGYYLRVQSLSDIVTTTL